MHNRDENILLLGSYGRGNIGDDAFLLAALQLFADNHLFINSANDQLLPAAVRGKVTTIATAGNKDLLQKLQVFRSIRHIVYCGGDVWVELYGDRFPRQSLYKMVVVNALARLFGKKVHYLGCGIGRLSGYSLFLARLSARLANSIAVREARSERVLALKKVRVLPDLVTTLDVSGSAAARSAEQVPARKSQDEALRGGVHSETSGLRYSADRAAAEPRKFTVGVSILYHLPNPEKNFPKLIAILSSVLGKLPVTHYRIVLFPMLASPAERHDDVWASGRLEQAMPDADVSIFGGREVDEYVTALTNVDLVIGARLHADIIALLAGVPVLGIAYRPKVAQFFAISGLAHYCIDLDQLTPERLEERLHYMRDNRKTVLRDFQKARQRITAEKGGYQNFVAENF